MTPEDRKFFLKECKFHIGATKEEHIPSHELPEIAFIGRSNVGKSSLINSILNNKNIARTSHTPGRTQQLNFFLLDNSLSIVDLPGYGFAKASKASINDWNQLVRNYLFGRKNLIRTFLLIDSRHGIKPNDTEFMLKLDQAAVSYQIILTKNDLVSKTHLDKIKIEIEKLFLNHLALVHEILSASSHTKNGIDLIREQILFSISKYQ